MRRFLFIPGVLALCFGLSGQDAGLFSRLDSKLAETLTSSRAPSVSVAVVADGRLAYAKAFGKADLAKNVAATPDTRYAIGSVSKQFTAAAILLLQEDGKVSLDDKVSKYFPDLTRSGEITIRQLLSHTSGYEDYAPQDYIIPAWTRPTTSQAIMDGWAKKPLNFDPGTKWQYSNTGYVIAGEIVEKATGQTLVSFLQARVFRPLSMASAGDCSVPIPADASAYTRFALGPARPVAREGAGWYNGASELCMTPADLAKWDVAFIEKRILSAKSYEDFTREVKLTDGKGTRYALGLSVGESGDGPVYSHTGEVSGFLASNTVYPAKRAAVIVCSNQDGINLIGAVSGQITRTVFDANTAASDAEAATVRSILEGLQQGRIDRSLFTSNANAYFTDAALGDFGSSLRELGRLKSVTKSGQQLRGGMTHLSYRAQFDKKTMALNIYRTTDGKFEQYMVEETF